MTRKQYADITLEAAFLIFLSKRENAPPIKSGALYQNTVPFPRAQNPNRFFPVEEGLGFCVFFGYEYYRNGENAGPSLIIKPEKESELLIMRKLISCTYAAGSVITDVPVDYLVFSHLPLRQCDRPFHALYTIGIRSCYDEGKSAAEQKDEPNRLKEQNARLQHDLDCVHASVSFRLGRALTWVPRKLRGGVRCYRDHGLRHTVRRFFEHITGRA